MIPWRLLDRAQVQDGGEALLLYQCGDEFSIRIARGSELMNSRTHGSEDALGELACARIATRPRPRVLVGGLGMGFTLAAALRQLPANAGLCVVELVPEVITWNRGPLAPLAGSPLDDPRVMVQAADVAHVLRGEPAAWDAVLLDVDNGPEGQTRRENDWLYGPAGLSTILAALRPGGVLAVWSAAPNRGFTADLGKAGFRVEEHRVRAHGGRGSRHVIWIAERKTGRKSGTSPATRPRP